MIDGKSVLAVCPARGGSKGIPLKNIRLIGGVPMVARVGNVVRAVPPIDRAIVSTDHDRIAQIAVESGLDAPFRRPADLSGDRVADLPVLVHALQECERIDGRRYDVVVMLQPTSPLRRPKHVNDAISMLVSGGWDAVWTVSETDSKNHPLKQLSVNSDRLDYYDERGVAIVARQQLQPLFHRNGIAYAFTRECLLEQRTIMGRRTGALVLEGHFVSIDTEWDCAMVEFIMEKLEGMHAE
jgi:CMP-N,N'-diacetyllegionaminic acid synthase